MTNNITEKNNKQDTDIARLQEQNEYIKNDISEIKKLLTNHLTNVSKEINHLKIRMAYIVGGVSIGFIIVQFIFQYLL